MCMSLIIGTSIYKTFKNGSVEQSVLRGIDIQIDAGEFVAIMGRSGAGKSTLLYQLSALDRPSAGEVIIDGRQVLDFGEEELVKFRLYTLGYIFQDYALIPDLTAIENVLTPLLMRGMDWDEAYGLAQGALRSVGLEGKETSAPSEMSGGEQQRVSIARAIAGKPKILFADEPTANLDSVSGQQVIDLLKSLHEGGQTIVMVTHEPEYAQGCDRVIYLEDGQVVDTL